MPVEFVVEEAGCASCAALVEEALSGVGTVESIEVDEEADVLRVRLAPTRDAVTPVELDRALADAGAGSGHAYRVQPGSIETS